MAVGVLYALGYFLASRQERTRRDLTRLIENLALNEFRATADVDEFAGGIAVVIPAYNEAGNIVQVLGTLPPEISGLPLHAIVVDDGSSDDTMERARAWARPQCISLNRGQGAALRTGYRLALATGARLVVTMDADGQHQPSELPGLIQPILDDKVDVVNGSRVLGAADPNHAHGSSGSRCSPGRSLLTASRVTDPACGYRAVRTEALRDLEFHQDQFHNSEFILEASKRKLRTMEVPVTVSSRLSGASKKPPHFRHGLGFANALSAPGSAERPNAVA